MTDPGCVYYKAADGRLIPLSQVGPEGPPGPKGDKGDPGSGGGASTLDALTDVAAPATTPAGKVLGTTAVGQWGPVDAPGGLPPTTGGAAPAGGRWNTGADPNPTSGTGRIAVGNEWLSIDHVDAAGVDQSSWLHTLVVGSQVILSPIPAGGEHLVTLTDAQVLDHSNGPWVDNLEFTGTPLDAAVYTGATGFNVRPAAGAGAKPGDVLTLDAAKAPAWQAPTAPALALDALTDVTAPATTRAGKFLGTTATGQWGPVDGPPFWDRTLGMFGLKQSGWDLFDPDATYHPGDVVEWGVPEGVWIAQKDIIGDGRADPSTVPGNWQRVSIVPPTGLGGGGGAAPPEVAVGPTEPTEPSVLLWVKTGATVVVPLGTWDFQTTASFSDGKVAPTASNQVHIGVKDNTGVDHAAAFAAVVAGTVVTLTQGATKVDLVASGPFGTTLGHTLTYTSAGNVGALTAGPVTVTIGATP